MIATTGIAPLQTSNLYRIPTMSTWQQSVDERPSQHQPHLVATTLIAYPASINPPQILPHRVIARPHVHNLHPRIHDRHNCLTEMCSDSEEGWYLRLIDFGVTEL